MIFIFKKGKTVKKNWKKDRSFAKGFNKGNRKKETILMKHILKAGVFYTWGVFY